MDNWHKYHIQNRDSGLFSGSLLVIFGKEFFLSQTQKMVEGENYGNSGREKELQKWWGADRFLDRIWEKCLMPKVRGKTNLLAGHIFRFAYVREKNFDKKQERKIINNKSPYLSQVLAIARLVTF